MKERLQIDFYGIEPFLTPFELRYDGDSNSYILIVGGSKYLIDDDDASVLFDNCSVYKEKLSKLFQNNEDKITYLNNGSKNFLNPKLMTSENYSHRENELKVLSNEINQFIAQRMSQ